MQSRFCSSNAPSPHRNDLPGAANSGSENTSPTVEKALMLKSPPMKSMLCCTMWAWESPWKRVEASRFLATMLWTWTEQNVTMRGLKVRGDAADHEQPGQPSSMGLCWKSEVRITASVRNELVREKWSMVAGFMKDDRMESSASRRNDVRGILECWARIPLEYREAVLMMHEVAVCVEKKRKTRHRKYCGCGFRKGFMTPYGQRC